jgi:hypothetical protein
MAISFAKSEPMRFSFYLSDMLEGKIYGNYSYIYAILKKPFILWCRQPQQQNLRLAKINVFVASDACLRAEGNDFQPSFERGE